MNMNAQIIESFGGTDVFRSAELPKPQLPPGHVLIRVAATSVNPIDCKIRAGVVPALLPELPAVLHGDVAGVVEAVGEGVTAFRPGDEVYGCAGGMRGTACGALADYMAADAALLAFKPRTLSMRESAALPIAAITAWQALIERAAVRPGQRVLVHAAAGGVGHLGVQLAKWAGAEVYATASPAKLALALALGADVAIDYTAETVAQYVEAHTGGRGFDVVFDTVGGANLDRSFEAAALNGTVAAIAARSTHDLSPLHGKGLSLHVVFMAIPLVQGSGRSRLGEALTRIAELVDAGKLRPLLDPKHFTFEQVGQAHAYLESGQAVGKVTLVNGNF